MFSSSNEPNNYFYNLSVLTLEERAQLGYVAGEYVGLVVRPLSNSNASISDVEFDVISDLAELKKKRESITAISVAGLGCAAHGAASMARQIANVIDAPVIALIPSKTQQNLSSAVNSPVDFVEQGLAESASNFDSPPDHDVDLLCELLRMSRDNLRYLIGYSRGGWVISHSLAQLGRKAFPSEAPTVITFGGVVDLPSYLICKQYLGELDMVGAMNSDLNYPHEQVPMAGHHLNPAMALYLDLSQILREAITETIT